MAKARKKSKASARVARSGSVNEKIADRSVRHAVYLERLKTHEVNEVVKFLNDEVVPELLDRVERRLRQGAGAWGTQVASDVYVQANTILRAGMTKAGDLAETNLISVALSEAQWQTSLLAELVPVSISLASPSAELIAQVVKSQPMEGAILKDWFQKLGQDAAVKVTRDVKVGIAAGDSINDIVKSLKGGEPDVFKSAFNGSTMGEMNRNARAVVRTAVTQVTNEAKEEVFIANQDVIDKVQIVATLDSRTTDVCKAQDGKVYPVGRGPRPPFHWGCRSTAIPVTKSWKELGLSKKDVPAAARASMNGEVPGNITYGEWLKDQPASFQDEVLGKGRAALFRSGQVPIERFVDESGQRLTLAQVRLREGLDGTVPPPSGP